MPRPGSASEPFSLSYSVFVYGSLLEPARLDAVLGRRYGGSRLPARLEGYQRQLSPAYAFPFLVPAPAGRVDGLLLTDLVAADLAALDAYEEVGEGQYRRVTVAVQVGGDGPTDRTRAAQTYVAGPALLATVDQGHTESQELRAKSEERRAKSEERRAKS